MTKKKEGLVKWLLMWIKICLLSGELLESDIGCLRYLLPKNRRDLSQEILFSYERNCLGK